MTRVLLAILGLVAISTVAEVDKSKGIAIDFGNEWLKMCLVDSKAMTLLDMVINEQSNRKTPSVVGLSPEDDRYLGESALGLVWRNPTRAFPSLKRLLGKLKDDSAVRQYLKDFNDVHTIEGDKDRGTVVFKLGKHEFSVETLTAMLLQQTKKLSEVHAQTIAGLTSTPSISDAVLIVPESFSQNQRALLKQLATVAGLNVRGMINELSAVAIDYGVRNVESDKKVIFYGIGSQGVSAALVEFKKLPDNGGISVQVLATASDDTIGGMSWDTRLRSLLVSEFEKQHPKVKAPITSNKRAMSKLLREAREAKEQLSASPLISLIIEDLYENRDLKLELTRDQLEAATTALSAKLAGPIQSVLQASKLGLEEITGGIELYGGGVRVPKVQATLKEAFPQVQIHKHVDGDESAVFGAGHYLAVLNGVKSAMSVSLKEAAQASNAITVGVLTEQQLQKVIGSLQEWDAKEESRKRTDAVKNALESYVMHVKDQLTSDHMNKGDNAAIKQQIESKLSSAQEFLDSSSHSTTEEEFRSTLDTLTKDVMELLSKTSAKPQAAKKAEDPKQAAKAAEENKRRQRERRRDRDRAIKDHAKKQAAKDADKDSSTSDKSKTTGNAKKATTGSAKKQPKKAAPPVHEDEL